MGRFVGEIPLGQCGVTRPATRANALVETRLLSVAEVLVDGVPVSREAVASAVAEHNAAHPEMPLVMRGDDVFALLEVGMQIGDEPNPLS